jgi:hypothetical protein
VHQLRFTADATHTLRELEEGGKAAESKLKKVRRALAHLQANPRHPGLHSHQYESFPGRTAEKVWDSYVENHAPAAWRLYWMYGPNEKDAAGNEISVITVLVIGPHL